MNPLFARELRARWRDRRAWWLLVALTIVLSLLANAMFLDGVSATARQVPVRTRTGYVYRDEQITPSAKAARAGRGLFSALAIGNVVAWLLIAPILTATPLARERERGLLESLQLSHLTPRSQIAARVAAALVFLLILQTAVAPVYAIIFWLGGVSPGELGIAGAVISLAALGGVALGTWISARSHRPSSALFAALGAVILWTLALWPAAYGAFGLAGNWYYPCAAVLWTHPLPLIWAITDTSGQIAGYLPTPFGWESGQLVAAVCAFWGALSLLLLVLATRAIRKPLAPAGWETKASAPVEWWRRSIAAREARAREQQRKRVARRVEGVLVADLPIDRWIRFADPLLEREVRSRFRLRRAGWAMMLGRFVLFGAGVFVWAWSIYSLSDVFMRASVNSTLLYFLWGLGALAVAALSSASLARERESGTWEGLKLSLLSPLEIVRAKWWAPLIAYAIYSAPLWFLLPFGLARENGKGMDLPAALICVGIVLLSLGTTAMIGLLISWRARQPNTALGWILGLGLFVFVAMPILREATDADSKVTGFLYGARAPARYRPFNSLPESEQNAANFVYLTSFYHPISALNYVQGWAGDKKDSFQNGPSPQSALVVQLLVFLAIVGGGGWALTREIGRDKERGSKT